MEKIILAILALALAFSVKAQTSWTPTKLDENVTLSFPGVANKGKSGPMEKFELKAADSTSSYRVLFVDFRKLSGNDADSSQAAEEISNSLEQTEFWEFLGQQFFASNKDITIINQEQITVGKKTGRKFELDVKNDEGKPNSAVTVYMYFVGTNMYITSFTNRHGKADVKNKEVFFNSIKITE